MFRYLISPEGNNTYSHFSAITVLPGANDTITVYFHNVTHIQGAPAMLDSQALYCLEAYFAHYPKHNYSFISQDDVEHGARHSHDAGEIEQYHCHFRLPSAISLADMQNFLQTMRRCQAMITLPTGYEFYTAAVADDVVAKYREYKVRKNKTDNFLASNSPAYKQLYATNSTMPTIQEHALCLLNGSDSCTPTNPFTPVPYRLTYNAIVEQQAAVNANQNVISASVVGLVVLGIFAFKNRQRCHYAPVAQTELTFEEKIKNSLARLT